MEGQQIDVTALWTGEFEVLTMAFRCTCLGAFHIAYDLGQIGGQSDTGNPLKYFNRKDETSGEFQQCSMPQEIDFCRC